MQWRMLKWAGDIPNCQNKQSTFLSIPVAYNHKQEGQPLPKRTASANTEKQYILQTLKNFKMDTAYLG